MFGVPPSSRRTRGAPSPWVVGGRPELPWTKPTRSYMNYATWRYWTRCLNNNHKLYKVMPESRKSPEASLHPRGGVLIKGLQMAQSPGDDKLPRTGFLNTDNFPRQKWPRLEHLCHGGLLLAVALANSANSRRYTRSYDLGRRRESFGSSGGTVEFDVVSRSVQRLFFRSVLFARFRTTVK